MEPTQHDVHVPSSPPLQAGGTRSRRGQVRAIARAAGRTCSRPGCDTPAAATLVFSYSEQVARLVDLLEEGEPQAYDLCPVHADRTRPPVGWELSDTRPPRSDAPRRLDDAETVAVLAAALRGEDPPTRVSIVEGGRTEDPPHQQDEDRVAPGTETDADAAGEEEDPLRAALEELQRVATPDDDVAEPAMATPLRRRIAIDTGTDADTAAAEGGDASTPVDGTTRATGTTGATGVPDLSWTDLDLTAHEAGDPSGAPTAAPEDDPTLW